MRLIGQPVTWTYNGQLYAGKCAPFAGPVGSGQIIFTGGMQDGTLAALFEKVLAATRVVTTAREGEHVVKSPDNGAWDGGEVMDRKGSCSDEMQVHNVRIKCGHSAKGSIGGPVIAPAC